IRFSLQLPRRAGLQRHRPHDCGDQGRGRQETDISSISLSRTIVSRPSDSCGGGSAVGESDELSQTDLALLGALKTIIDIILVSGRAEPRAFDKSFGSLEDAYLKQGDAKASALLRLLRDFANNPERATARELDGILRQTPPAGSA